MPLSWIVALLLVAVFAKRPGLKKSSGAIALGLLLFFSNSFIANKCMQLWETSYVPIEEVRNYDIAVVLSGILKPSRETFDRAEYNKGAGRLLHSIQLYKAGKVKKLLFTGGKVSIAEKRVAAESDVMKSVAVMLGVPDKDIILENKAMNTYENALYTRQILKENFSSSTPVLLITSAFHMRRAQACFTKQNIQFDCFPTDYYSSSLTTNPLDSVYPSLGALNNWNIMIKELVGIIMYRLKGYI